jgi:hypothetical protein
MGAFEKRLKDVEENVAKIQTININDTVQQAQ